MFITCSFSSIGIWYPSRDIISNFLKGVAMHTRKDYLAGKCSHAEYYSQFADIFSLVVKQKHTKVEWLKLLSEDEHLNNVPLKWWSSLAIYSKGAVSRRNKIINGTHSWALSTIVCAAKQAVKELVERSQS